MTDKPTRGRRSKVDLLPEPIRRELDAMLRDGRLTQQDILDGINDLIEQHNLPEDMQLSRSGLNRYATRIESIGKDLRELREVSNALVSQLGDKPTGDLSRMILEIGRTQLFKAMMRQAESPNEEVDIGMVKDAMLAAQRLEAAAMSSHRREKEIRQQLLDEQRAKLEAMPNQGGVTEETKAAIREALGIV
ncbi:hypothetical protein AN401_11665 [Zobellella denitrificans]|uniref:Small terminase subunit n=1 Tax=Zobellella denitrificans TaxID=347534 RepID=A0A291HQJ4_9GAMM|nr:DUF3486 family protein [Zobellella denitrificans]ATG74430.1 hypothetical protein AN401_11665 [Zobellella denitrificans]